MFFDRERFRLKTLRQCLDSVQTSARHSLQWYESSHQFFEYFIRDIPDSAPMIQTLINGRITLRDRVLTTPAHVPFFQTYTKQISVYDISPKELLAYEGPFPTYWCDILHKKALSTLLSTTRPSTIYLSNILDYAHTEEKLFVANVLSDNPFLRQIIHVAHNSAPLGRCKFKDILSDYHWSSTQSYDHHSRQSATLFSR